MENETISMEEIINETARKQSVWSAEIYRELILAHIRKQGLPSSRIEADSLMAQSSYISEKMSLQCYEMVKRGAIVFAKKIVDDLSQASEAATASENENMKAKKKTKSDIWN